ncbi:GDSL-like Lipase/Acylhydrolase family protein [compost metagenome]
MLQRELTKRCGFTVLVDNRAVPGTYASQLLYGSPEYRGVPFEEFMSISTADATIFAFGINDALMKTAPESYRYHMYRLGEIARAHGKRVIFETPNPVAALRANVPDWQRPWLDALVPLLSTVASSLGAPLVDQYSPYRDRDLALDPSFPDGIHPSQATAVEKAMRAADVAERVICPRA